MLAILILLHTQDIKYMLIEMSVDRHSFMTNCQLVRFLAPYATFSIKLFTIY